MYRRAVEGLLEEPTGGSYCGGDFIKWDMLTEGPEASPIKAVIATSDCRYYLTPGKRYRVEAVYKDKHDFWFRFTDDNGVLKWSRLKNSVHMNWNNWFIALHIWRGSYENDLEKNKHYLQD